LILTGSYITLGTGNILKTTSDNERAVR